MSCRVYRSCSKIREKLLLHISPIMHKNATNQSLRWPENVSDQQISPSYNVKFCLKRCWLMCNNLEYAWSGEIVQSRTQSSLIFSFSTGIWKSYQCAQNLLGRTKKQIHNLVPRALSSPLLRWNTPRIVGYFVTWHMMKWLFRRLILASGGPVCFFCNLKPLLKRKEDISKCLRDKILTNVWSHFGSLGQGISPTAILNEEKALGTTLTNSRWWRANVCRAVKGCSESRFIF